MKGYELNVTFDCNWHCDYCIAYTHEQPKRRFEDVIKEIEELPADISSVTLAGGEPGMLSEAQIEEIMISLIEKNKIIDLMTNGLFFERYPSLIRFTDEIFYHCIEDLSQRKDIRPYPEFINQANRYYVLVAINESFDDIQYYIDKYPEIKFLILGDYRGTNLIKIKEFLRFIQYNKDKINERTLIEFATDVGRI